MLSTYNCEFVRGDVPARQSLPPPGHGDMWQGMVLSHQPCQDRDVSILVVGWAMGACAMGTMALSISELL